MQPLYMSGRCQYKFFRSRAQTRLVFSSFEARRA